MVSEIRRISVKVFGVDTLVGAMRKKSHCISIAEKMMHVQEAFKAYPKDKITDIWESLMAQSHMKLSQKEIKLCIKSTRLFLEKFDAENNLDHYPYASEVATERRHMVDFIGKLQNELRVREMRPHKVTT